MNFFVLPNNQSLHDIIQTSMKEEWLPIQVGPDAEQQMLRTQKHYKFKGEENYIHILIEDADMFEVILYATEEDTFYNFEMVVSQCDKNVHLIINAISLDGRLAKNYIEDLYYRLETKDITSESLVFKNVFYDELDSKVQIMIHDPVLHKKFHDKFKKLEG